MTPNAEISEKQLLKRINKTCYHLFVEFSKKLVAARAHGAE